jgi:hypothetical protein
MKKCGPCPVFASFTLATEEKARKNLSRGKKKYIAVRFVPGFQNPQVIKCELLCNIERAARRTVLSMGTLTCMMQLS